MRKTTAGIAAAIAAATMATTMGHASASVAQFDHRFSGYPWMRVSPKLADVLSEGTSASPKWEHCAVYVVRPQRVLCPSGWTERVHMGHLLWKENEYTSYKYAFTFFGEWTPVSKSEAQKLTSLTGDDGYEWEKGMSHKSLVVEPNGHVHKG